MSPLRLVPVILFAAIAAIPTSLRAANSALSADDHATVGYSGATEVLSCAFDLPHDEELHGWPPGWTRRHGPGYPRYVRIGVADDRPPVGGRCLRVELDGGAASAFGPSIAIQSGVDYILEGYVKTTGLEHDVAWLSATFLDSARVRVADVNSRETGGTSSWRKVRIGPLTPPPAASQLIIGVNLAPKGDVQDLHGGASFGALWVGRLPRIVLATRGGETAEANRDSVPPANSRIAGEAPPLVFLRGKPIDVSCLASGLPAGQYDVRWTLQDSAGNAVSRHRTNPSANQSSVTGNGDAKQTVGRQTPIGPALGDPISTTWRIPGDAVGYYQVRAEVLPASRRPTNDKTVQVVPQASLALAIVDPESPATDSEFGWSLAAGDTALGFASLGDALTRSGIRWVKFPFACALSTKPVADKPATKDRSIRPQTDQMEPLINFSDRLSDAGVGLIGALYSRQPGRETSQSGPVLTAAEAFLGKPETWYPSIEPIQARLANQIRVWQIGDDRDLSWTGCSELATGVARIKSVFDRIGQDVDIGIAWDFAAPLPVAGQSAAVPNRSTRDRPKRDQRPPWRFLAVPCGDRVSDAELAAWLDRTASAGVARWISIDALPRENEGAEGPNGRDERIAFLIGRAITAKCHGADRIFFVHPFDSQRGLLDRDGSPTELFLPWRTTALTLGGLPYVGEFDLRSGNRIQCFGSRGRYVGVLSSARPQQESVYLGDELQSRDLWGRVASRRPTVAAGIIASASSPALQSTVEAQRLPIFLTALDAPITEWQLNVGFVPRSLPSISASVMSVELQLTNTLPRPASGRVHITPPRDWQVEPRLVEFHLEPGAKARLPLQIILPNTVIAGRQILGLEWDIQADRLYHFTMFRPIEITLGDVQFSGRATVAARGELEVRQTLSNGGKRAVGFRCDLSAPDRRRQSMEVVLRPGEKSQFVYRLPDGRDLLDKQLWLRAEELNGSRVLNYRVETAAK